MTTLRWGLLGTARINRALIPPLRVSPRNRVTTVASRDRAKAEAYAREWGIPRAHGSYEALLADAEVDVIYNPLPNHLHAEWTIRALQAGKHVLCEKPLALTPAEVEAMAAAAAASGKVLMEAFMYRHHPQTLKVKELVQGGAIGALQLVRGAFSFPLTRDADVRLVKEWGGGSIWDVGCYPISYARYIAGAEPVEVFGQQFIGRGAVDEAFIGQMRFPGDVFAQFDSAFRSPFRTQLEIVGSAGLITVAVPFKPGLNESISLTRDDASETISVPGQELYRGEVEDMADAILNGTPPRVSLADSRGNVATMVALLQSAREGRAVKTGNG
jgi:predicted dehydrogenase